LPPPAALLHFLPNSDIDTPQGSSFLDSPRSELAAFHIKSSSISFFPAFPPSFLSTKPFFSFHFPSSSNLSFFVSRTASLFEAGPSFLRPFTSLFPDTVCQEPVISLSHPKEKKDTTENQNATYRLQVKPSKMAQQMAQSRENAFNPQSPHSSPGGDDSYNNESTPDTRLTTFSPDENSARSAKFSKPLGQYATEPLPVRFPAAYGNGYNQGSVLADKDPFTSTSAPGKPGQKLSATASAFHPFPSPLIARGSATIIPISNALSPPGANQNFQSAIKRLSADIGLSRYLVITSTIQSIFPADVEVFLIVCLPQLPIV